METWSKSYILQEEGISYKKRFRWMVNPQGKQTQNSQRKKYLFLYIVDIYMIIIIAIDE